MSFNSPIPADAPSDAPVARPPCATGAVIPVLAPPDAPAASLRPPRAAGAISSPATGAREQRLRVVDLVGEEVLRVEPHQLGWCIRFGSGARLFIPAGAALDAAGAPVIEL